MNKSLHSSHKMASNEGKVFITVDKFGGKNFSLYRFKLKMMFSTKNLWKIVEGSQAPPISTTRDEVKNVHKRRCKNAFAIITINLVDKESKSNDVEDLQKRGKCYVTSMRQINSCNILFTMPKFFTVNEDDNMVDHINKVKSLTDHLTCFEALMKARNMIMILLSSLPSSFDH